ncbi:malate dehydrogenase [Variovorax sp. Sphag1AA]|uniref:malate dehydrogenase n=1 Tax=Variovorax sp. Sphag1AA TaxID=2587027 RepID=UPI00160F785C|nr:malate dehydrogenase [Variovorax sp. Sphag1AA]MBB3180977.1 malate dehydrogenase [Variovorax sp. Sphag1AA]
MSIVTAADVEAAGARLQLRPGQRLTPLARDRAKELGVEIVEAGAAAPAVPTAPSTSPAATPMQPAKDASASARPATSLAASAGGSTRPFAPLVSGAMYRRNGLGPQGANGGGRRPRAGVVGAGHVGAMAALRLAESDLFDHVAIVDVVPGLAAGLALDMWHGAGLYGFSTPLSGSDDLSSLRGCDYIIITAGKPRQPGMTRTDLTAGNAAIMKSVCEGIRQHAPDATLVVVSNPLEEMTHLAAQYTGFAQSRVLGMAGVLDSARFCALVGLTGKARPQDVRALALGSHGPEMVIPLSQAFVGNAPIESVLDASTLSAIVERTRESGGEVVKLLKTGSAYFSPAESAAAMVRIMASGSNEVIAACVRPQGAYGLTDARVGLPVRLDRRGLKEVVQLPLRPGELQALREAAARIAQRIEELAQLPSAPSAPAPAAATA